MLQPMTRRRPGAPGNAHVQGASGLRDCKGE